MEANTGEDVPRRRVIIIGLDGATLTLAGPWMDEGILPNLAYIREHGVCGPLASTILPISGPAWTSFMTGKNPGKHSIYDFLKRRAGSYERRVINAADIDGRTLWEITGDKGRRVCVVNVPVTFPPRPVNGVLVAGMLTPSTRSEFTYPRELAEELEQRFGPYRLSVTGGTISPGKEDEFIADVEAVLNQREQTMLYLLSCEPYDLFVFVFFETDVMQHKFWGYQEHEDSPHRWAIRWCYQRVDRAIGRLLERLDDNTSLFVMSDHGGGALDGIVLLNRWLMDQGLLRLKEGAGMRFKRWLSRNNPILKGYDLLLKMGWGKMSGIVPRSLRLRVINAFVSLEDVDWAQTRAYSCGHFGQIFINLKGREPEGIVEPGAEYEALREEIIVGLYEIEDPESRERIVDRVYRREEIYHGPHLQEMPDLLLLMGGMRYVSSSDQLGWDSPSLFAPSIYGDTGTHRLHGLFMAMGKGIRQGEVLEEASIMDVAPTALYAMGLPVPQDMDGRVLTGIFEPAFLTTHPIEYDEEEEKEPTKGRQGFSAQDERLVEERLRSLGYLG